MSGGDGADWADRGGWGVRQMGLIGWIERHWKVAKPVGYPSF